jgi:hypothetical protein
MCVWLTHKESLMGIKVTFKDMDRTKLAVFKEDGEYLGLICRHRHYTPRPERKASCVWEGRLGKFRNKFAARTKPRVKRLIRNYYANLQTITIGELLLMRKRQNEENARRAQSSLDSA